MATTTIPPSHGVSSGLQNKVHKKHQKNSEYSPTLRCNKSWDHIFQESAFVTHSEPQHDTDKKSQTTSKNTNENPILTRHHEESTDEPMLVTPITRIWPWAWITISNHTRSSTESKYKTLQMWAMTNWDTTLQFELQQPPRNCRLWSLNWYSIHQMLQQELEIA
jgi:hypothetical protein